MGGKRHAGVWVVMTGLLLAGVLPAAGQTAPATGAASAPAATAGARGRGAARGGARGAARAPTRADILKGEYGQLRNNNDLLYYHLDIRVDPEKKTLAGKNTVRFKMLKDDNRIQLDLSAALNVDKILLGERELKYTRELGAVFIDFPDMLRTGQTYAIDFQYSGTPQSSGRFGGMTFGTDPARRPWIYTACEDVGASSWWPCKDQWRDEVENMDISVAVPNALTDVSNGKFAGKKDLGDGYTRWDWQVHYPINSYCVSVNIGTYTHFEDKHGTMPIDFYVLPEDLERAKVTFAQAKGMLDAYEHYFGEYPFAQDGYKLVQAPYSGMEHQSAVTYGNGFRNGYGGRDWTGVGISLKFDFIIIHESGHEWWGNAISGADRSDMWIHEGWTTYLEGLYVEYTWNKDDAIKYLNGYKSKVVNGSPIIPARNINASPQSSDQYFKGALMLNTLRTAVDDDKKWFALLRDTFQHFKYHNIMTEELVAYINQQTGRDWTAVFDQYLRHTALPVLELQADAGTVRYRWRADEAKFDLPVRVGPKDKALLLFPTTEWQTAKTVLTKAELTVPLDLYYITVDAK